MEFGTDAVPPKDELPQPPSFGSSLRRLREERGLSRERLAFNAGVSASYVTSLEKGDRAHPTREVIEALLRCLQRLSELGPGQRRLLFDLAGLPATELPDIEDLRADLGRYPTADVGGGSAFRGAQHQLSGPHPDLPRAAPVTLGARSLGGAARPEG